MSIKEINTVLFGVESAKQLEDILHSVNGSLPDIPRELFIDDDKLLNPSNW